MPSALACGPCPGSVCSFFCCHWGRPGLNQRWKTEISGGQGGLGRSLGSRQALAFLEGHGPWETDHEVEIWVRVVFWGVLLMSGGGVGGGGEESREMAAAEALGRPTSSSGAGTAFGDATV